MECSRRTFRITIRSVLPTSNPNGYVLYTENNQEGLMLCPALFQKSLSYPYSTLKSWFICHIRDRHLCVINVINESFNLKWVTEKPKEGSQMNKTLLLNRKRRSRELHKSKLNSSHPTVVDSR